MHFVDSHAHLTSDELYPRVEDLLKNAKNEKVHTIVNICTDKASLERGLDLRQKYPEVVLTAAVHPHEVDQIGEAFFEDVVKQAKAKNLVAIGETGLDYHYEFSKRNTQQEFLRRHLQLALECQLPVVIHCREAFVDFFSILDQEYRLNDQWAPGVLHCFTGTLEEAEQVIQRGWYLSLSGIVTFKKSEELREVARKIPLERLLIETDAPFLAPQSKRGKPNQPSYLPEIAQAIALARDLPLEKIAEATKNNAYALFNL